MKIIWPKIISSNKKYKRMIDKNKLQVKDKEEDNRKVNLKNTLLIKKYNKLTYQIIF